MLKLNRDKYRDKVLACWIGKNIGGTVGGPFEGTTEMQDVTGFTTKQGEPLPNDDLDLQIAWLMTLERVGARCLDANALADTWMTIISPHWNEYGIAHKNLKMGLLPPLSGELDNKLWRNSNGAWIRSEIWACLPLVLFSPLFPFLSPTRPVLWVRLCLGEPLSLNRLTLCSCRNPTAQRTLDQKMRLVLTPSA